MSLVRACEARYGFRGCTLRPLAGGVSDHTFALKRTGAETLVLRVESADGDSIPIHEQVLLFLEERGYPAPRVIRAVDGAPFVEYEGSRLVLTTFIDGPLVETGANSPAGLYEMGRAIGRLHILDGLDRDLPRAQFMPENEVRWAQERLATVADRVPSASRHRYDGMLRTLAAMPSLAGLSLCLIHNDCHPGNAVYQKKDGTVTLIDWDGAGLGPAILDLGFLLITADTYTPDVPTFGESDARVNAIVDGYCHYRVPDTAELAHLEDAIRFRVTVINAATFARFLQGSESDRLSNAWWDGCAAAEQLAGRARRRFDQHRA